MKIIAVAAVVILVIAGAAAAFVMLDSSSEEEKGLYKLDAKTVDVNMGQCSATPSVVLTIESIYQAYYGDLVKSDFTMEEIRNDATFWSTYGEWTPVIKEAAGNTFDVDIYTKAKGAETLNIPKLDRVICMGTMYSETIYFLICQKHGMEPYSQESLESDAVKNEFTKIVVGGMNYGYYEDNDISYMLNFADKTKYFDLKTNSVQKLDPEDLTAALEGAMEGGKKVGYFASGTRISSADHYANNTNPCITKGQSYAFFGPSNINEVYPSIDAIGKLLGFDESIINGLIEKIQKRLYAVHYSVAKKNEGVEKPLVYWESGSGKAVKSSMAKVIVEYLGFDARLMDGAEHDLESLLVDKPSMLIFYTNDKRSLEDRMRAN